jgi:hypothetical protein
MKKQFLFVAFTLCCVLLSSKSIGQTTTICDTLFLKEGPIFQAKVRLVTTTEVQYYRCDQTEGSPLLIRWTDLKEIHYANGTQRNQKGEILPAALRDSSWVIETIDDNTYVGIIREQNPEKVVLETRNLGTITLLRSNIRRIQSLRPEQIRNGEIWYDSPHATRYLFGPNGYSLKRGEGYYQNVWIWFNQISFGVTDRFTLGFGMVPLFFFSAPTPVWITPKYSIPIKEGKVNLGVGALLATILSSNDNGGGNSFGVAYGQLTLGSRDRNVNFGLGYGYAGNSWANSPTLSFSTMQRVNKKLAFVSENYLFDTGDDNIGLISAGFRFLGRRIAIDGALVVPVEPDIEFIAIPWLGINVPIGKK